MTSIYLAGGWKFRHNIKKVIPKFEEAGIKVISTWIKRENGVNTPKMLANDALLDIEEVLEADITVAIMDDDSYAYRGTFTEIGCALGQGKRVIIVCPGTATKIGDIEYEYSHYCMTNVFYWHPLVTQVKTVEEAIEKLTS